MRRAFSSEDGPLTDMQTEPGERLGMMDLFAGAIEAFKNPDSHRDVDFADPVEAVEVVQFADLITAVPSAIRPQQI